MELKTQQVDQFVRDGYLMVDSFFTEREVKAMRLELERLQRDGALRNVATDGDGLTRSYTKFNLQICPMHHKSTLYRALAFHPKVVSAVRALIGDPVVRHLDQSFVKPARSGMPTNWHQDNAYFKVENPLTGTAMWIAIHEATRENGTLKVIPGSHRRAFDHERDPDSDHHIRCYPSEEEAVHAELKPGGVIFFCYGTAHATGSNTTDRDRAGVAYHFLNGGSAPDTLEIGVEGGLPYVTGPNATGGLREYGVQVDGTWENEVDRVLAELEEAAAK
jgi:phytanoyl-CoA hydroxylase